MRNHLEAFFQPRHIAIVGVSQSMSSFGGISFLRKLQEAGFPGILYPINPKATEIRGLRTYPNLSSLPVVAHLAMVCMAAAHVPAVLEECGRIGLRYIHILTSGFKEIGTEHLVALLGSTGALGVPLYTEIVDSGGDSWGRRNLPCARPASDSEALSCWAGGGSAAQPEGDAVARVDAYLGSLKTLTAQFSQVVQDKDEPDQPVLFKK